MISKKHIYQLFPILLLLFVSNTILFAQSEAEKEAAEIYAKYQEAIGGKEALAKIKTVETIIEIERNGQKSRATKIEDKVNNR